MASHPSRALAVAICIPKADVDLGRLEKGCVIKLNDFVTATARNGRPVMVVMSANILSPGISTIGRPQNNLGPTCQIPELDDGVRRGEHELKVPLAELNTVLSKRCTVLAKVVRKMQMRSWQNSRGSGVYFSIDLCDGSGPAVRATFFKEAASSWYDRIKEGSTYNFIGGQAKASQHSGESNIELVFDKTAKISEVPGASLSSTAPSALPRTTLLGDLRGYHGERVDLVAVVSRVFGVDEVQSRSRGEPIIKRNVILADRTAPAVSLTLWAKDAEGCTLQPGDVVAVRQARVGEYNGKATLSKGSGCSITPNPDTPDAKALRDWWHAGGAETALPPTKTTAMPQPRSRSGPPQKLIPDSTLQKLLAEKEAMCGTVLATIMGIRRDTVDYTACPKCSRKVSYAEDGGWLCVPCSESFPQCSRRYVLQLSVSDHTSGASVTMFNECAEALIGTPAERMESEGGLDGIRSRICYHPLAMTLRAKQGQNGERELVVVAVSAPQANPLEARDILEAVRRTA